MVRRFILIFAILLGMLPHAVFASSIDGTIDPQYHWAWSKDFGWLNFGADQGNIHVTDSGLTGYIWSINAGWINLAPLNSGQQVRNDGEGHLSGFAWAQNTGWASATGITIDANGFFRGTSSSTNAGIFTFDCDQCSVKTDWRPISVRTGNPPSVPSGVSGGTSGSSSPTMAPPTPIPVPPTSPTPLLETLATILPKMQRPVTVSPPGFPHTGFSTEGKNTTGDVGSPIRLTIPKIKIDAGIEYVGLAPDGSMGVPKGGKNVAWFNLGPRPGEIGSAVVAGHFGRWKNGKGSVFDDLHKLRKGDKLYVKDVKGSIITFVVRELRTYGEHEDASEVFSSSDGKAHLNLITCEGVWNKVTKSYSKRLVVFADKEE